MKIEKNLLNSNTSYTKLTFPFIFADYNKIVENIVNIPCYPQSSPRNLFTNFRV